MSPHEWVTAATVVTLLVQLAAHMRAFGRLEGVVSRLSSAVDRLESR